MLLQIDANQISIYTLRDCMVNKKKGCKDANFEPYKESDVKDFGADAKIIIALLKKQPQKRLELCENAGIHESTFSRYKRLLTNRGILKDDDKGFSLWYYKEVPSLWDSLVEQMKNAGGHLIKIQIEKLRLGDQNPITGWFEKIYDEIISTKGVIVLRGATKLEDVLHLRIPREYIAFLVAPVSVRAGDRFMWQNKIYDVKDTEQFFDGETLSYTLAKLTSLLR